MVNTLQKSLAERFNGILCNIDIDPPKNVQTPNKANISFDSQLHLLASALDPSYSLLWLDDRPGSDEVKKQIKERVISMVTKEVSFVLASLTQTTNSDQPDISMQPVKKARMSLFKSYEKRRQEISSSKLQLKSSISASAVATVYITQMMIIASQATGDKAWLLVKETDHYSIMQPILEKYFASP